MMKADVVGMSPAPSESGENRRARVRFLAGLLALLASYYTLTAIPWVDAHLLLPVLKLSATATSWLLNLFGADTGTEGVIVRGRSYAIAVRRGCDPLDPMALFAAGVLAFPAAWRGKLEGLLVGCAMIFALNLLRLGSLYLLGATGSPWFRTIHEEWWPAGLVLLAFGMWLGWLRRLQRPGKASNA